MASPAPPPAAGAPTWARRGEPLVVAHRGASALALENTLEAFLLAETQGADAVELDVMRCGSGELIVFHDDDLRRLAGRPERVRETPLSALRTVRLHADPEGFPVEANDARIPTLHEVFDALAPGTLVNVELKSPERQGLGHAASVLDDGLAAAVASLLADRRVEPRVLVSSFDPMQLLRFRARRPGVATGYLFHGDLARPLREAWPARLVRPAAMHPEAGLITAARVAAWHRRGLAVNVWTVDDPRAVRFLRAVGVDGVITNRPAETRAALAERAEGTPTRT